MGQDSFQSGNYYRLGGFATLLFLVATSACELNIRSNVPLNEDGTVQMTSTPTPTVDPIADLLSTAGGIADSWTVKSGATSMDITATLKESGTLYYVVYNADPGVMTASQIKTAATGATGGSLVYVGTLPVSTSMQSVSAALTSMPDATTYYVKIAAEGGIVGLYPDSVVRSYTRVHPDKLQRTNFTSVTFSAGFTIRYMTYFPEPYYKESTNTYPLLIVLHGQGENAASAVADTDGNFETVMRTNSGLMRRIEDGSIPSVPMMVIQPRCPNYIGGGCWSWANSMGLIDEILEHAKTNLRVDTTRVYISGLSTGGGGAIRYANTYPSKVAAVAPIAMVSETINCTSLASIPFWFFHNELDPTQSSSNSVNARNALVSCPSLTAPRLTRYAGSSTHNSWDKTYNGTGGAEVSGDQAYSNLFTWLLTHSK